MYHIVSNSKFFIILKFADFLIINMCLLLIWLIPSQTVLSQEYSATPHNYLQLIRGLKAGDKLMLEAGIYMNGLQVKNLHGTLSQPIVISGPAQIDQIAILPGDQRQRQNTIQLKNTSYVIIRNLTIDGLNLPNIDAVNAKGITHHITLENLKILRHGGHQQTVGIATRGPAWNWVIRNNLILGAGTGIYLGSSDGRNPFIHGLIEYNVILDTRGYNMEIKHQRGRPRHPEVQQGSNRTIIRHNVFSKENNASMGDKARPNVLVGHWPLEGAGSKDSYEIYGNFFYQNPSEALFQGEGNISLYNNLFINDFGDAISIQRHKNKPKDIKIFHNTIVAKDTGVRVAHANTNYKQSLFANAIFAGQTIKARKANVKEKYNIEKSYTNASKYLNNPLARPGKLDLYPKQGELQRFLSANIPFKDLSDFNRDFNGVKRSGKHIGAYSGSGQNNGWLPKLEHKPGYN